MFLKKTYFIFLAVLLVAMMSVAVAADVNDSTTESITPAVTHTTDNVDTQTATQASNEITKKINETSIKESVQNTPKTVIVDSTNYSTVFLNDTLNSTINDGDTIDVQEDIINTDLNITINKAINLTTTTGATIYLNTTGGNLLGTNPGNSFKIVNNGSYTNVTNLKFYNTQVFVINAHHVTMDNINVTVENRTVGSGVGVTSIRDNSTYVTVKNSNFYTKNNGGSSSVVLAWADYCTIDNNNITGEGNVGNLMYLTTYNINGTPEYAVDINMYNNITNNNITAVSVTGPCVGVVVTGHDNKFENNKVNVSSSFAGQWMSPTMNEQGDHDDRWEGNSYINNKVYGSFTGTKNSTITDNKFNKTVSLPERCIFKNNNAENSTVRVTGSNCDLCNNRIYHLTVNSGVTNTMVCLDNVFINGYEGIFTPYIHPTSSGLNKNSYRSVKTDGEPTVIDVYESNFYEYFEINAYGYFKLNETTLGQFNNVIYNLYYMPIDNITEVYTSLNNMMGGYGKSVTIVDKTNMTLKNIDLYFWNLLFTKYELKNFKFEYDEDYQRNYAPIRLDQMSMSAGSSESILTNITVTYTTENFGTDFATTPIQIFTAQSPSMTIQNSTFNINIASNNKEDITTNSNGITIKAPNTKFINNIINVNELYPLNDSSYMIGVYATSTANNLIFTGNTVTVNGESTLYGLKLDSNTSTITNNNITVTTTGTATGVELNGNDNTVTDNYIVANDKKGDAAVTATGENNVVQDNTPLPPIEVDISIVSPETININQETPVVIIIKDADGNPINNEEAVITIDDGEGESRTVENGMIIYNLTPTQAGTLTFKVTLDPKYAPNEVTKEITVNEDKDAIIAELNNTVQEQEEIISNLNDTVNSLNDTVNEQAGTIESLNNTIQEQAATISDLNNTVNTQAGTIESLNNTVQQQAATIGTLNDTVNSQAGTIANLNNKVQQQAATISSLSDTVNEQASTIETLNSTVQQQAGTIENLNSTVQDQAATIGALNDTVNSQADTITNLNSTVQDQAATISSLNDTVNSQADTIANLNSTVQDQASTISSLNDTLNEQATTIENLTGEIEKQGSQIQLLSGIVQTLYDEVMNLTSVKNTTITVNPVSTVELNGQITVTGKLVDNDGEALTNSVVKVSINGAENVAVTDSKGAYKLTTTTKTVGTNNVTVTYEGTSKYNPSSTATTFTVNKADCIITIDSVTSAKYGENVTIIGTFKNSAGKAIANSKVRIDVNGAATYVKTDNNGVFVLTTTANKAGEGTIVASYGGSSNYNSYKTNTTFNVEKQDLIITADDVSYTDGKVTIKGTFKNAVGTVVKNTNVRISLNGKTYYAKSDANGIFTFTQDITTNKITYTLGYGGSATYNAYTGTKTTLTFA